MCGAVSPRRGWVWEIQTIAPIDRAIENNSFLWLVGVILSFFFAKVGCPVAKIRFFGANYKNNLVV